MKSLSLLILLGVLCSNASGAEARQVRCQETKKGSEKRVYALIRHEDQWEVIYKSKSHRNWIRVPLLRYEPKLTKSTLQIDYTSPLEGVRIKWSVKGKESSLFVSNSHDVEVNDVDYFDLDPDIDEMNTKTTLKNLSTEIGDLKIKLE